LIIRVISNRMNASGMVLRLLMLLVLELEEPELAGEEPELAGEERELAREG
jgi:hypothetical protein